MAPAWQDVLDALGYTLSLPERVGRSLAAALGGLTRLLTDTLVPEPLRRSQTYAAIVGNAQRFVIEKIAEVRDVYAAEANAAMPEDYVRRKIAGNVMEAAGMFSMHLSPLWVFAIAADVADGSKVYLNRLVEELKSQQVIAPEAEIQGLEDVLGAVGRAGRQSAQLFDAPPVKAADIRKLRDDLLGSYAGVLGRAGELLPRMDELWGRMESLARRDGVAVGAIAGLMTADVGELAARAAGAATALGNTTADLFGETLLGSYGETINRVQRDGAVACLEEAARPYLAAVGDHLRAGRETYTERLWRRVTKKSE